MNCFLHIDKVKIQKYQFMDKNKFVTKNFIDSNMFSPYFHATLIINTQCVGSILHYFDLLTKCLKPCCFFSPSNDVYARLPYKTMLL